MYGNFLRDRLISRPERT